MWWSNKTINSLKCCNSTFHMFHDFVVILYLSYYYHVAMFQGMRNSCCIHRLHHYYSQQSSMKHTQLKMLHVHVSVTMTWWDRRCTCLWNEMQLVEAKHLGCYRSRISSFRTWSILVWPQIHRNIRISATLSCWTCWIFVGQHSAPYNIAGLIAVL